ncbi:hypothetical protein TrRE_jg6778 [Triparma retinervis]|uniref:NADP-dependent oxidoreductase domain-containing protein n=1 Tax=Triparma retinervis TaxID=2557542 RepID=A0A9W7G878_9STRA|nr:hypothetical protein TrRE_jg6778 [Triparma retinervis]
MEYQQLGDSDLVVSRVCMGTMTFGRQNTLEEGVEQLTKAFDEYGVNFIDTAEMYPVPTQPETAGDTDRTVAAFLKTRKRSEVILATKVSGTSDRISWLRSNGELCKLNKVQITESIDASLKRLEVDYIDLLQMHWPDRYVGGLFGQPDYDVNKEHEEGTDSTFEEQLGALNDAVKAGKYAKDKVDEKARLNLFPGFMARYKDSQVEKAVAAYSSIASSHGLTPTQLSLSWCYHRPHVTSSIIGATTLEQLEENLKAFDVRLTEECLEEIEDVYKVFTDPTKAYGVGKEKKNNKAD